MHHSYSSKKGDSLCPLGFHPQVRWPTRCKRCFRDYKDHGDKKGNSANITSSSPSLSSWNASQGKPSANSNYKNNWSSATNLLPKDKFNDYGDADIAPSSTSLGDLTLVDKDVDVTRVAARKENVRAAAAYPEKLQIKGVINKSSQDTSNDVEFIIQVKKSRNTPASKTNAILNEQNKLAGKEDETEKGQIEKLKTMLSEMKAKYEKSEREKADMLLRRLSTMETISSKSAASELAKLQKLTKELEGKNVALVEDKSSLLRRLRNLEDQVHSKPYKGDKDKTIVELNSKLKAAENLCENLMDENEDMKKEIRDLEEEMYELQDNFREEQADEYINLRKSLEQSNKNCRILSFKLRKVERKAEALETEKTDLRKQYDEVNKIEDTLKKVRTDLENKSQKKSLDLMSKVQMKRMMEDMEKELGNAISLVANMKDGKESENHDVKAKEDNSKYESLSKEYEALKEKYESTTKELNQEREKKKAPRKVEEDDKKSKDLLSLKKKLDDVTSSKESDRKAWDKEKATYTEEKEKLKSKLLSLSAEKLKLHNEIVQLNKDLEAAKSSESVCVKLESTVDELKKELTTERQKYKKMQDDLLTHIERENELKQTIASVEQAKTKLDAEVKHLAQEVENTRVSTSTKLTDLNTELSKAKKEKEKLKLQADKDKQSKETELAVLKKKITSLERIDMNTKKIDEVKQAYDEKIASLEVEVKNEKEKCKKLQTEYDQVSDLKTQLEKENTSLNRKLSERESDFTNVQVELDTLKRRLKAKENEWQSEKSQLEERMRETSINKPQGNELNNKINTLTKENSHLMEQLEDMKKLNEDLSAKLKDYDAVSKVHNTLTADTTALESEIREMKKAVANGEKTKKAELAQCKMRYEHRITALSDELQAIQNQLTRHKRERDTYKHMLEGAQKTIAELKSIQQQRRQSSASSIKSDKDDEETMNYIAVLEKQISCMEDELSEARLDSSSVKAELVSEKSAWNIKLSELQSRINELEEERLITSRRSKIPGLKVRMELAWQKEREEQQRLLQETATLARDLRQTLFEIERERVNERIEYKRRQDQLKKVLDEEKEENKKKLIELQSDLLELRDAHAKLRTSNEKMRREKERHVKEREELKELIVNQYKLEKNEMQNVDILLQQVENLQKLFPELNVKNENGLSEVTTPTPPRRLKGPKSRESSPMLETKGASKGSATLVEERMEKLKYTIRALNGVAKELEASKKVFDDVNTLRLKRFPKRSTSVDSDPGKVITSSYSKPRLKRKSISLEHTTGRNEEPQYIWSTHSNVSSLQSLEGSDAGSQTFNMQRDSSVDSRLSGGSTKSEMLHRPKKHGKSLIGKITTKLTKSASVDDPQMGYSFQSSGSEASIDDTAKLEKKNLKKKLTDMFKRGSKISK